MIIFYNVKTTLKQKSKIFVFLFIIILSYFSLSGENLLTEDMLDETSYVFIEDFFWKYKIGDDIKWTDPEYNTIKWEIISPDERNSFFRHLNLSNSIFYRCDFKIDDSLIGKRFAIKVLHLGEINLYYNGKIIHRSHQFDKSNGNIKTNYGIWEILTFDNLQLHNITIKYKNDSFSYYQSLGLNTGFIMLLAPMENLGSFYNRIQVKFTVFRIQMSLIPIILAFIHFFLFLFYPKLKQNLFYFLCLIFFSINFYSMMQRFIASEPKDIVFFYRIFTITNTIALFFLLLTVYSIVRKKTVKKYLFLFMAISIGIFGYFKPRGLIYYIIFIFTVAIILEIFFVLKKSGFLIKKENILIFIGVIILIAVVIYQSIFIIPKMISQNTVEAPREFYMVYTYGGAVFIFFMSLYLSSQFAVINKNLKKQLDQVKKLSEENILKEKKVREQEIKRRVLEEDNNRKTKELDEAKKLQLSMLPDKTPRLKGIKISAEMITATEVGGDYYDFYEGENGSLTVVLGDATGHGMKAGTMVTVFKSLFNNYDESKGLIDFFSLSSKLIKKMKLKNLFMAVSAIQIKEKKISIVSAGMPPVLIYRKRKGTIEEIVSKAPPLGGFDGYIYKKKESLINKGDVILLFSDGFSELFNMKDQMLEIGGVKKIFLEETLRSSSNIISNMLKAGNKWSDGRVQEDDITFVVIEFT